MKNEYADYNTTLRTLSRLKAEIAQAKAEAEALRPQITEFDPQIENLRDVQARFLLDLTKLEQLRADSTDRDALEKEDAAKMNEWKKKSGQTIKAKNATDKQSKELQKKIKELAAADPNHPDIAQVYFDPDPEKGSIHETAFWASKSQKSTVCALNITEIIKKATLVRTVPAKPAPNRQTSHFTFCGMHILYTHVRYYGTAKLTIGEKRNGDCTQYCITSMMVRIKKPRGGQPFQKKSSRQCGSLTVFPAVKCRSLSYHVLLYR